MVNAGDNELIEATLAGDRGAFAQLVDRYQIKIFNMAFRVTGSREDAQDVTQAAFLKSYDNLARYKPAHRFFSWLYRIAMNEALDVVARRRRYSELDPETPTSAAGPEAECLGSQAGRRLQAALMELTPDYRAVIVLRHFHGLSYVEIAEVVGTRARTVKSRLFTARRLLRQRLTRDGVTV